MTTGEANVPLTGMSLGYSNSLKGVSYGVNYNIDRTKDANGNWPENRQISFNVSVPFSIFGYSRNLQSMYATTTLTHDNTGRTLSQTGLSGNTMDGKLSYSAWQSWGNQGQISNTNLNTGYQGSKGKYQRRIQLQQRYAGYQHERQWRGDGA